jgi:hypothetical protein
MQELIGFLCTHRRFLVLAFLCISLTALAAVFLVRSLFTPDTGLIRYDPEVVVTDDGARQSTEVNSARPGGAHPGTEADPARPGGALFKPSAPASAVALAGLIPDRDTILSLNGVPVRNTRDLVRGVASITSFDPFPLVARRDTGEVVTLEVRPFFRPARIDWLFNLVFCLALVITAFTVSWRLPQEDGTLPVVLSALLTLVSPPGSSSSSRSFSPGGADPGGCARGSSRPYAFCTPVSAPFAPACTRAGWIRARKRSWFCTGAWDSA